MAQQVINLGTAPDDGTGDPLRDALDKCNDNFTELYASSGLTLDTDSLGRSTIPGKYLGNRTQGLTLRHALRDIEDGTRKALRVMCIGDSLGAYTWNPVNAQLQDVFQSWMTDESVLGYYVGRNYTIDLPSGAGISATIAARTSNTLATGSTAASLSKTDYNVAWDGSYVEITSAEIAIYAFGGNSIVADKISIPLIRESGAGTVKIEIATAINANIGAGSGLWRDPTVGEIVSSHTLTGSELLVDLDGTPTACDVVQLSVDLDRYIVKITHNSGGTARTLWPLFEVDTNSAVNVWHQASGSNDFTSATTACEAIYTDLIDAYQPDMIIVDSDDRLAAYQNFVPKLENSINASSMTVKPFVLLVGNPGYDNAPFGDSDIIERIDYCWDFASSRVGWDVVDGMALSGGITQLQAVNWDNDGIHLQDEIYRDIARKWAYSRGYVNLQQVRPGGDVASRANLYASEGQRFITADEVKSLLVNPFALDTAPLTWSYLVSGTGAGTNGTDNALQLASGSTAGSDVVAYFNGTGTPFGFDQGNRPSQYAGGFSFHARMTSVSAANGVAYALWSNRTYNAAYAGALTAIGVGFIFENNVVSGIAWDGSSQGKTTDNVVMVSGGPADWYACSVVLTPRAVDASHGLAEFFVNGVSLGTLSYLHSGNLNGIPRFELTNAADAATFTMRVTKPKLVTIF